MSAKNISKSECEERVNGAKALRLPTPDYMHCRDRKDHFKVVGLKDMANTNKR